jgi:hypothetical protein
MISPWSVVAFGGMRCVYPKFRSGATCARPHPA